MVGIEKRPQHQVGQQHIGRFQQAPHIGCGRGLGGVDHRPDQQYLVCEVFLKLGTARKQELELQQVAKAQRLITHGRRETEPFVVVSAAASNANSATARSTRIWIAVLR